MAKSRNVLDTPPAMPSLDGSLSSTASTSSNQVFSASTPLNESLSASTSSNESLSNVSTIRMNSIATDIGEDRPKLSWPNLDVLKYVPIASSNKQRMSEPIRKYVREKVAHTFLQMNRRKFNEMKKLVDSKGAEKNMPEIVEIDDSVPEIKPGQSSKNDDDDVEIVEVVTAVPKVTENILKRKLDVRESERAVKRKAAAWKLMPFLVEHIKDIKDGREEALLLIKTCPKFVNKDPDVIVIDDDDENDTGNVQMKVNSDCAEKCAAQKENSPENPLFGSNQVSEKTFVESEITQVNSDPEISGNQVLERPENSEVSEDTQANLPTTIVNSEVPVASSEIPQEKLPLDKNVGPNECLDEFLDSCFSGDIRTGEGMDCDDDFFTL